MERDRTVPCASMTMMIYRAGPSCPLLERADVRWQLHDGRGEASVALARSGRTGEKGRRETCISLDTKPAFMSLFTKRRRAWREGVGAWNRGKFILLRIRMCGGIWKFFFLRIPVGKERGLGTVGGPSNHKLT